MKIVDTMTGWLALPLQGVRDGHEAVLMRQVGLRAHLVVEQTARVERLKHEDRRVVARDKAARAKQRESAIGTARTEATAAVRLRDCACIATDDLVTRVVARVAGDEGGRGCKGLVTLSFLPMRCLHTLSPHLYWMPPVLLKATS